DSSRARLGGAWAALGERAYPRGWPAFGLSASGPNRPTAAAGAPHAPAHLPASPMKQAIVKASGAALRAPGGIPRTREAPTCWGYDLLGIYASDAGPLGARR